MAEWRERLAEYRRIPGLQQQLGESAQAMCAPFWWSLQDIPNQPARILNNGTICYLNTGTAEIGVTANHVLDEYLGHLARYGDVAVECQFGSSTISPEKRVTAQHSRLDLATVSVPEVFVTAGNRNPKTQHKPLKWPPAKARIGELVLYGGHPGTLRVDNVRTADLPFQWVMGGVSDVSYESIVLEPDFETLTWLNPEPGETFNRDFAGMSGGPVFRVIDQPLVRIELIGFIYLFVVDVDADGQPKEEGHTVLARYADFVQADGTVVSL